MLVLTMVAAVFAGCSSKKEEPQNTAEPKKEEQKLDYPKKPIEVIVAYSAGGGTDVGARILASVAEKYVGQSLAVVNKPGAGGAVGFSALASSRPDGYTIGLINIPSIILHPLQRDVAYEIDQFEPIIQLVEDPGLLVVKKGGKLKNFDDFMKYAKENPGKLTVGNCGVGTDIHMITEAIAQKGEIDLKPIPFGGTAEAVTATIGGHVDATIAKVSEAQGPIDSGEIIAIAALTEERHPAFPDVPTLKELGIDIQIASSRGIAAPKGTPKEIIDYLHKTLKEATEDPEYIKKMEQAGLAIKYRGPEDFKNFIMKQNDVFAEMVDKLGLGKK